MKAVSRHAAARRLGMAGLIVAVLAGFAGTRAFAMTAAGSIVTNVVTATMTSGFPDFVAYTVSYNATAQVVVASAPVVKLAKYASTPLCAAGCTVTFQVCIENQQVDTAWAVTVTDILPGNTTLVQMYTAVGAGLNYDTSSSGQFSAALGGLNASLSSSMAGPWSAPGGAGQGAPYYLRWVFGVGSARSACVSYSVRIL